MHIAQALLVVAERFPTLRPEATVMSTLLTDMPAGMGSLPASVLGAAFEALAFGAGPYSRRWLYLEAAILLGGHNPQSMDVACAVGVWGAVLGRATQVYRARASEAPPVEGKPDPARPLMALIELLGREVAVLLEASEVIRVRHAREEAARKAKASERTAERKVPAAKRAAPKKAAATVAVGA